MSKPTFQILETEGCIELISIGELTIYNESAFRFHLLKLLMHGKSKCYKLNLRRVESINASCIQLIQILKRQIAAVDASLIIDLPEDSGSNAYQRNAAFWKKIVQPR
jgi:anti-anti-sigma regulatory factor